MAKTYVAFWWHQHQPYYKDPLTGTCTLPWVRLHGVKDYHGMAALIGEFPEIRATINFVPSLLVQIIDYVNGTGEDTSLRLSRKPAADLTADDRRHVLGNFFTANAEWMIRPNARYADLLTKRRPRDPDIDAAVRRFSDQDLLDLQVWANLVWFHPTTVEKDGALQELLLKGRDFTEQDKSEVLRRQMEVIADVIPLHRRLEEGGQLETTTTPFYHPILPLLCNPEVAREAMPNVVLPDEADKNEEDAREQVTRALAYHEETFGRRPRGMWPSEGSVSQRMAEIVREAGVEWIGTDEQILERSVRQQILRGSRGDVKSADLLYRPYLLETNSGPLAAVFRDHNLSDLIGFHYQRSTAEDAAKDMVSRLARVKPSGDTPPLVSIILDGENAWEYYPRSGADFLRALYEQLCDHPDVEPVTVSGYLDRFPPGEKLRRIFAGSWINHNFAIWIGHEEDRKAWDYLYKTRRFLVEQEQAGGLDKESAAHAWEEIYIAEGSDWFWWYGDDHHTEQINEFDDLFRRHLRNVYTLCGAHSPLYLDQPIAQIATASKHSQPRGFLRVTVDGRITSFLEWVDAGHCNLTRSGAMDQAGERFMRELYFGFSETELFLRIDVEGEKDLVTQKSDALRIRFYSPREAAILVEDLYAETQVVRIAEGRVGDGPGPAAAYDHVVEIACPFAALGFQENENVGFYVELIRDGAVHERAPRLSGIEFAVPSADFEKIAWQV